MFDWSTFSTNSFLKTWASSTTTRSYSLEHVTVLESTLHGLAGPDVYERIVSPSILALRHPVREPSLVKAGGSLIHKT